MPEPGSSRAVAGRRQGRSLGLAAAAFAVGLLLGAVGWAVAGEDDTPAPPAATAPETTSPAESDPAALETTVAASCVRSARLAEEVLGLAEEAIGAIAELDARRLQELVNSMQQREPELREQAARCRQADVVAEE